MRSITGFLLIAVVGSTALPGCVQDDPNTDDLPDAAAVDTTPAAAEPPVGDTAGSDADPADTPTSNAAIPAQYVGKWDADAAACARTTNEMRLTVSPGVMQFYEGRGAVSAVRTTGDGIAVDLDMEAEGTQFKRTYQLSTNAAADRLMATTDQSSAERVRCPNGN